MNSFHGTLEVMDTQRVFIYYPNDHISVHHTAYTFTPAECFSEKNILQGVNKCVSCHGPRTYITSVCMYVYI